MARYIINHDANGYERVNIDDDRLENSDNVIVLILNSESTDLQLYYNKVIDIILSRAKLYTIVIGKESNIRKAILMVMVQYKNYNIYKVDSADIIDSEYLANIENRNPDIVEVQQYIGGDITAYSDLSMIINGISQLTSEGNLDGLKNFIEQHIESIESSMEVIEYLKVVSGTVNNGELVGIINKLRAKEAQNTLDIRTLNDDIKQYRLDKDNLNDTLNSKEKEIQSLTRRVNGLEDQLKNSSSGPVINNYQTYNTAIRPCKVPYIIYFKEITYTKYTNTLVVNLLELLKKRLGEKSVKLMIYDNKVGIPASYKNVSILSSNEYLNNKRNILRETTKFVVTEPNIIFIEDVLTSIDPKFESIIVYDRLKQVEDIVSGNNVSKIIVVNSAGNLSYAKNSIRIPAGTQILTSDSSVPGSYQIMDIPDYSKQTVSAQIGKYGKLPAREGSSEKLIESILKKARILDKG